MSQEFDDFLERLRQRMDSAGEDLPIFSASQRRLRSVGLGRKPAYICDILLPFAACVLSASPQIPRPGGQV